MFPFPSLHFWETFWSSLLFRRCRPFIRHQNFSFLVLFLRWYPFESRISTIVIEQNVQMYHSLFWPITWRAWVRVSRRPPKLRGAILVLVFRLCKYVVFCLGLLLTRRWKLREVFMTVVMYRSQQRGLRGQSQIQVKVRKWDRVCWTWLKAFFLAWLENLMAFHSLCLLLESKVSLR